MLTMQFLAKNLNVPRLQIRTLSTNSTLHNDYINNFKFLKEVLDNEYEEKAKVPKKVGSLYKGLTAFNNKQKLEEILLKSIIYMNPEDKSGLIGLNKPYGLPNYPSQDCNYSLQSFLPFLAQKLDHENLEIVKTTDRYSSGVTLLAPNKDVKQKLENSRSRLRNERLLNDSYLCIVDGFVNLDHIEDFCIQLKEFPHVENPLFSKVHKEPVIAKYKNCRWGRLKNKEKLVHVHISSIKRASKVPLTLVNLSPTTTHNHLIRVYLADKLCPLLGDKFYSYRAQTILGKKVKSRNNKVVASNGAQILPAQTLELLGLSKDDSWRIPAYIHRWRYILPGWLGKDKNLAILAPPPHYFNKTLKEAGIKFDFKEFVTNDSPKHFNARIKPKKKETHSENSSSESDENVVVVE